MLKDYCPWGSGVGRSYKVSCMCQICGINIPGMDNVNQPEDNTE